MKKLITILLFIVLYSCGTYSKDYVQVKSFYGKNIITSENDTIPTKKILTERLLKGYTYQLRTKKGRCVDARRIK